MNWEQTVVQRTLEGAGDYPRVQLAFLLRRLEAHPDAMPAIAAAIRDMGRWLESHADALEDEGRRRDGGAEVIRLQRAKEGGPDR
jgi:ABC-type nitrate/sulfonate/bicarbonate transport system substrate-binding protein